MKNYENNNLEKPLCFAEASRFLNVSKSHLYKLTHRKLIPHFKPSGKLIYFLKKDLLNWLLRNRVKTVSEIEQESVDYIAIRNNNKESKNE